MSQRPLIDVYRENEQALFTFLVKRLKSVFTARDLTHDLYLKIQALDDISAIGNLRAYLFRMAANLATDHQRRENRRQELVSEAQMFLETETYPITPEDSLIAKDELLRLEEAIGKLPPQMRRVLYMSRFENLSQREIAKREGVSPTAVFKCLQNAMEQLAAVRDP